MAQTFAAEIQKNGHNVEWADLLEEGFDPVLREPDEPDWLDPNKRYSPAVHEEMQRVERNEATVMIFPVFWWSLPALQKGWIDRVWNNGWAYGDGSYPHRRVWFIGIAGNDKAAYRKRGYDSAIDTQLNVGILDYCNITDRRVELLYGSIEGAPFVEQILAGTKRLGMEF